MASIRFPSLLDLFCDPVEILHSLLQLASSRRFDRVFLSSRAYGPLSCSACRPQSPHYLPWDRSDTGGRVANGGLKSSRVQARGARRGFSSQAPSDDAPRGLAPDQETGASNQIKSRMTNVVAVRGVSGHDLAPTHHL